MAINMELDNLNTLSDNQNKDTAISEHKEISVYGARTHNLKNINCQLPRNKLVTITGPSGCGKSSLAFDTLYAEGQRRYVESLSTYARQFLSVMDKPDVDHIEGLSPAISIEQKTTSHNPRSTVGTITELYDYLRLLFARVGIPECPVHHEPLAAQTVSEMVDQLLEQPENSRWMILAPVIRGRKGAHEVLLNQLKQKGFIRVRVDGLVSDLDELPTLNKKQKHDIEAVVDRIKIKPENRVRLSESIETALNLAEQICIAVNLDTEESITFSSRFACKICGYSLTELEPRLFSFNNPHGACEACDGLGTMMQFDVDKIILNDEYSLSEGAIRGWDRYHQYYYDMLKSLSLHFGFDLDKPWKKLSKKHKKIILYGSEEEVTFNFSGDRNRKIQQNYAFEGIIPTMERRYRETSSDMTRDELAEFLSQKPCSECNGTRLKESARHVFIENNNIADVCDWTIIEAYKFFNELKLSGARGEISSTINKEIKARLGFLVDVGLTYLTLSRSAETLSGGEGQRIRLASQIGSGLVGVMYVLDEPTIGLHQRDNDRLLKTLSRLRDLGNTVIVVEHDEDTMLASDYLLDIGPGAGVHGGEIVAEGSPTEVINNPKSLTGRYLRGIESIAIPKKRLVYDENKVLTIDGASGHNLKGITVKFPIGLFTVVTGVSGSGKSTLINETLYPALINSVPTRVFLDTQPFKAITGFEDFKQVIDIDQSPIGRTPRSNPATYTGLFTPIRELFAGTQEARTRGYKPGRFSFNVPGGRCEACQGDGVIKVEMHFLADVYVPCDTCNGKRYNRETLDVLYKGKSILDVLEMTVEDALQFFDAVPVIKRRCQTLFDVGLGYIKLGQNALTLSGGEAQRVKLAKELSKRNTGMCCYILDEPTTGLHFNDVKQLLKVIMRLRDQGHTIIMIEHNLDVIKTADWLIDLGPEGGAGGGQLLFAGTPEDLAEHKSSHTGRYLKKLLSR